MESNILIKWIKGFIKHPIKILKGVLYRLLNKKIDLANKRLAICNKCPDKINTSLGDACYYCGCILDSKTRLENEHCDMNKW